MVFNQDQIIQSGKIYHLPVFDSDCHNSNKWQQTNLRIAVNLDRGMVMGLMIIR